MRKLLLIALLPLAGCATNGGDQVWEKPGAGNQEFAMDQGQCHAQAFSVPNAPPMQIAFVYNSCMRGKGWYLTSARK